MSYVTPTTIVTAEKAPLKAFHFHFDNKASLITTLGHLGFEVPAAVTALAAANEPLGKGGHQIDLHQLDTVLAGYDVSTRLKIQLKNELSRQGLLKSRDKGASERQEMAVADCPTFTTKGQ